MAALWVLPSEVADTLRAATAGAALLAVALSALPVLTGEARERNERRFLQPTEGERAENVRWSVMAVLSVIPLVNPLAWVFAALDAEESSAVYWSFAALYALPYLASGVEVDAFTLALLALGAAHVQVERVAQTEPAEVELPAVLRSLLRALPAALRTLGRATARVGGEVAERTRSAEEAAKRRPDRRYIEERSAEARMELDEFDRRRREREVQQQGGKGKPDDKRNQNGNGWQ